MKTLKIKLLFLSLLFIFSCSNDDDNGPSQPDPQVIDNPNQDVQEFIWNGMNQVYLYKADVPDLANDRFSNNVELYTFLNRFSSPQELFDGLQSSQDRFSFLVDDYIALEQAFSGVSKSNGMDFGLTLISNTSDDVLGFVRYILPGTDAEAKGVLRGQFFSSIDGEQLTRNSNFGELFGRDSYEVGFVAINGAGEVIPDRTVTLTKAEYTENPVLISKTLDHEGQKIGYMMYNSFTANFDEQLNNAFGDFKADGITDLVLDLRYNGGGSVRTAIDLSAMITGQFPGEIFSREIWNDELQAQFTEERLTNKFVDTIRTGTLINSLNLTKVHVLTTDRTASASELVINGLAPYIDVVQIGETTTGKFQASITLYDSPNFRRENADPDHTFAMQPLVLKSANRDGVTDFIDGLAPDVVFEERITDFGVLGEVDEPFLKAALDFIIDGTLPAKSKSDVIDTAIIGETKMFEPTYQKMYKDNLDSLCS